MALTALIGLARKGKFLLNENSRTILTGVGVTGTITTAYLTGRATFKAARIIEEEQRKLRYPTDPDSRAAQLAENEDIAKGSEEAKLRRKERLEKDLTRFEKLKLVWYHYIPPALACTATITCIIVANKIASKKIAALALAAGISERTLQEYKAKVVEKLGERQDTKIRDEIAQERVNNHPLGSREVILAGTGEVLCFDMATGRYFQSTVEEIKRAENKINHQLNNFMSASASEFYDEIGLPPTTYTDNVGWNANRHVEVELSSVLSPDGRPCLAIDFAQAPFADYHRHHD
jgi:Family of unknown function (DUF6353)